MLEYWFSHLISAQNTVENMGKEKEKPKRSLFSFIKKKKSIDKSEAKTQLKTANASKNDSKKVAVDTTKGKSYL